MKQTMKLTESQLHQLIRESVKEMLTELDWKTYANAAKKRLQQYRENPENKELWDKWYELNKMANQRFDDDYVGTMKYDTLGDRWKGKHSPKFDVHFDTSKTDRMPYGAVNGYNKGGNKIFSTDKGTYHSPNGITTPKSFFRDQEVADKFEKANDELWNYDMGNYDYTPEKGWHLKESQLRQIIRESIENTLNEGKRSNNKDYFKRDVEFEHFYGDRKYPVWTPIAKNDMPTDPQERKKAELHNKRLKMRYEPTMSMKLQDRQRWRYLTAVRKQFEQWAKENNIDLSEYDEDKDNHLFYRFMQNVYLNNNVKRRDFEDYLGFLRHIYGEGEDVYDGEYKKPSDFSTNPPF